jgi:tetratricopeptide (TPR) repeat protein
MSSDGGLPDAEALLAVVAGAEQAGRAAMEAGAADTAREVYGELLRIDPKNAQAQNGLALLALQDGDPAKAETLLRQATENAPDWPDAHQNLGMLLLSQGRTRRGLKAIETALTLKPNQPDLLYARATALMAAGRAHDAETDLHAVIAIDPAHAAANGDLGVLAVRRGSLDTALTHFQAAADSPAAQAQHWANLGNLHLMRNAPDAAEQAFRSGLSAFGESPDLLSGLAVCERRRGALADALDHAERARALSAESGASPARIAAVDNLIGTVRRETGDLDAARACFEDAVAADPHNAQARANLGLLQLLSGDWANGLENFEARLSDPANTASWGGVSAPDWDGSAPDGKTLIVLSEQGLGDAVQFARLVPALAERGAAVHLAVPPVLAPLIDGMDSRVTLVRPGQTPPAVDAKVMLLSLPRLLGMTGPADASGAAYLSAPAPSPAVAEALAAMTGLKVGVNWRGSPSHKEDFKRSVDPAALMPVLAAPGASFVSLALGPDAATPPAGVTDVSAHVADFADSAAVVAGLDLVITVDTATAHLAGALGVPCWTLLPFVPDWRWGLSGETTPWYDSMRLYRQPALGDWDSVIARVAADLAALAGPAAGEG